MENQSFHYHGEEILREEENKENEYCGEELDVMEERKEDFLENVKDTPPLKRVIIDDAFVEGVCIANKLYEEIVNTVLDSKDVLDQVSRTDKDLTLKEAVNEKIKDDISMDEKTKTKKESMVCNAIFRKGPSTPLAKRLRIPSEVKFETKKMKDEKPSNEVIKNIQLKVQDKIQVKVRQQENDLILVERKLEEANELLRNKIEECESHEKEASALKRNVQLLEKDLDNSNNRLETSNGNLAAMTDKADEFQRKCQLLESRLATEENKVISLESQLMSAKHAEEDTEKKFNEVNRSFKMLESEVTKLQANAEDSIKLVKSQEGEMKTLKEVLKSAEVAGNRAEMKVSELMNQVKIATEKNEVGQETLEQKERKIQMITRELESSERRLEEKTNAFKNFQEELEKQVGELLNF